MASRYYESDITRLLREVVAEHPEVEQSQREGRDMFWDRILDLDAQERQRRSEVPMKGYVYDPMPPQPGESRYLRATCEGAVAAALHSVLLVF